MTSAVRVLYTSTEVRSAIIDLFRDSRNERVAISAFVGNGAEAYLPSPKGIHLICSPTPGATNPDALRLLMSKGVRVEFVDSLHMKVYWAKGRGAVITSANLSTNAMGSGGLREAGVCLGPNELDIKRVLRGLERRPARPELRQLDRAHDEFHIRNGWKGVKRPRRSYVEWYKSSGRKRWKIFFYSKVDYDLSRKATEDIRDEFNKKPHDWIWSRLPRVQQNDWVLCGFTLGGRLRRLYWLFAERVVPVPKSDENYDREYPYEVIQIHGAKHRPPPPFSIDKRLVKSLRQVLRDRIIREYATPCELHARELRGICRLVR
jgi:hypothetical protein